MKVYYKKTILQLIDDEKTKAAKEAKKIKFIELTYDEWKELQEIVVSQRGLGVKIKPSDDGNPIGSITDFYYNGIKIIQETRMV